MATRLGSLEALRVLVETSKVGSLSAVGRKLGLSPAATSAALKSLERRLGTRIFERSTRAMRLTPQGQTLVPYVERSLELLDEARGLLSERDRTLQGSIRVTAPSYLSRQVLMPWFDVFLSKHVGVSLSLSVSDARRDLIRDEVDIAYQWAVAGHGIVYKSELDVRQAIDSGLLVRLFPDFLGEPCPLHAVLPSGRFVPARVRALVEFLAERFRSLKSGSASKS
jgi:DNA-binding transcriptional LysR family regulator